MGRTGRIGELFKLCLFSAFVLVCGVIQSQTLVLDLVDPNPDVGFGFGERIAIHGDYAFVCEPGQLGPLQGEERVQVYHRWEGGMNAWGWSQTITAPDSDGFWFGMGIRSWEGRLAIYRAPHPFNQLGALVCKDFTLFLYQLDAGGQWIEDGSIGGELLGLVPNPCLSAFGSENGIDGFGDVVCVTSNDINGGQKLQVYQRVGDAQWEEALATASFGYNTCINGSIIATTVGGSVSFYSTAGDSLWTISSVNIFPRNHGQRSMDLNETTIAIAQAGGPFGGEYSIGRILMYSSMQGANTPIDTITVAGSYAFGQSICLAGNRVVVNEGEVSDTARVFVFRRDEVDTNQWTLQYTIDAVYPLESDQMRPRLDLSDEGMMIMSKQQPWMPGSYINYQVTIWDLTNTEVTSIQHHENPVIALERTASRLRACVESDGVNSALNIRDMTGRLVKSSSTTKACEVGFDLTDIPRGVYVVQLMSPHQRSAVKFHW